MRLGTWSEAEMIAEERVVARKLEIVLFQSDDVLDRCERNVSGGEGARRTNVPLLRISHLLLLSPRSTGNDSRSSSNNCAISFLLFRSASL